MITRLLILFMALFTAGSHADLLETFRKPAKGEEGFYKHYKYDFLTYYYTLHKSNWKGTKVTLSDGSEWKLSSAFSLWHPKDHIVVSHFIKERVYLTNVTRNDYGTAKLIQRPEWGATHITEISSNKRLIKTTSHTGQHVLWRVKSSDVKFLAKWNDNDRIIIGANDNALSLSRYKIILINLDVDHKLFSDGDHYSGYVRVRLR